MGIYTRTDSPFYWKKYNQDPTTKQRPHRPQSTGISVAAPTAKQRAQNRADAEFQFQQDCIAFRKAEYGPAPVPEGKPAITVKAYAAQWLKDVAILHRGYDREMSVVNTLVADLGDIPLADLTATRVAKYRVTRITSGGVKARTADREVGVLRAMLSDATAYLDTNPIAGTNEMGNRKLDNLHWDDFESRWFTHEEFGRFIGAIQQRADILGIPRAEGVAFAQTAIQTLLRRSSLLKLTWGEYRDKGTAARPFSHLVPLDAKVSVAFAAVNSHLRKYLDVLPRDTPDRLIFPTFYRNLAHVTDPKARLVSANAHANKWFDRVCELAQLPCHRANNGLTFHSLRHSGATWLLQAGATVKQVMLIGGWRNAKLFLETYCHEDAVNVAAASERVFGKIAPFTRPQATKSRRPRARRGA